MEVSQLVKIYAQNGNTRYIDESRTIAQFNFTDTYTGPYDGTKYGIILPPPISAPYHYDSNYQDIYVTDNDPIRKAWTNAGCYMETPFSFNVLNWDITNHGYTMRNWHSEVRNPTEDEARIYMVPITSEVIEVMVDDYIVDRYYFKGTNEDYPDRVKLGIYIGAGIMFNADGPNHYDLIMHFAVESFGWGINLNGNRNVTHIYDPFAGSRSGDDGRGSKINHIYLPSCGVDRNGTECPYKHFNDCLIYGYNPMISYITIPRNEVARRDPYTMTYKIQENVSI